MDIVFKGLLGAAIAVAIHFTIASKHSYLAGLIAAAPIFALFAHATLAYFGRTGELAGAAQFHLLSMLPTALYLVLMWFLATRFNIWIALALAAVGWGIAAITLIVVWNKGAESIVGFLSTRFAAAAIVSTVICSLFAVGSRLYKQGLLTTGLGQYLGQPRYAGRSLAGLCVVVIGSTYLLTTQVESQAGHAPLPGDEHTCAQLQSALTLGPNSAAAQKIQHEAIASYVSLAKISRAVGDTNQASIYSSRARAVLVGSWIDASQHKPKFC